MKNQDRRQFLADVGRGMLVASVGSALASDLGLSPAWGEELDGRLTFGDLEPLVSLMQETTAEKLMPELVDRLGRGMPLQDMVAAAALANARSFGGEDYVGYHSFMALAPAWKMAQQLPEAQRPLPVLKVLYRNTDRINSFGGRETLRPIDPLTLPADAHGGELLRQTMRQADMAAAEGTFAALAEGKPVEAFEHLQYAVNEEVNVHRVVLAWRAWAALEITGASHAHTLLRQSVRFCVADERQLKQRGRDPSAIRELLPKLLDEHKLLASSLGSKRADARWIAETSRLIANSDRAAAASAVAAALAEGIAADDVGEAISLAANELLLRDPGVSKERASAQKPEGSIHGASTGVHASDAANAWRNIARVGSQRSRIASLIVGGFHTAGQAGGLNDELAPPEAYREQVSDSDSEVLLSGLHEAVTNRDQMRACAVVHRYGELNHSPRALFDALIDYAVSEDGALHAEKYYHTVCEEFQTTRPEYRWRHLIGLARVSASQYGEPAPGYQQSRDLLKLS